MKSYSFRPKKKSFSLRRIVSLLLFILVATLLVLRFATAGLLDFRSASFMMVVAPYASPWLEWSVLVFMLWHIFWFRKLDENRFFHSLRIGILVLLAILAVDVAYKTTISFSELAYVQQYQRWPYPGLPLELRQKRLEQFQGSYFLNMNQRTPPPTLLNPEIPLTSFSTKPPASSAPTARAQRHMESGDMAWFYKRYGYSAFEVDNRVLLSDFSNDELQHLIARVEMDGDPVARSALVVLYKHLREKPEDPKYVAFKEQIYSPTFLKLMLSDSCKIFAFLPQAILTEAFLRENRASNDCLEFAVTTKTITDFTNEDFKIFAGKLANERDPFSAYAFVVLYKHVAAHPNDPMYGEWKEKLYSPALIKMVARLCSPLMRCEVYESIPREILTDAFLKETLIRNGDFSCLENLPVTVALAKEILEFKPVTFLQLSADLQAQLLADRAWGHPFILKNRNAFSPSGLKHLLIRNHYLTDEEFVLKSLVMIPYRETILFSFLVDSPMNKNSELTNLRDKIGSLPSSERYNLTLDQIRKWHEEFKAQPTNTPKSL